MIPKYSGHKWLMSAHKLTDDSISQLGKDVADLLGDVFLGIYHLDQKALARVDWKNDRWISFVYYGGLATVDGNELTRLIVLAHDRMMRVEIDGAANKYLRLTFHQRHQREGGDFWDRCPSIITHVISIHKHYIQDAVEVDKSQEEG